VAVPWKFYLLFGHHIVDGILKGRYTYSKCHSLHMSGFRSAGNIYFCQ